MEEKKIISGFSKLSKTGKIKWIVENFFKDPESVMKELVSYWHKDHEQQKILDGFSENTISNFPMPYGIAPNFLIDGKTYAIPMVIEESSVVAVAAAGAKFWMDRGGFKTKVIGTTKVGQVHFQWFGDFEKLKKEEINLFNKLKNDALDLYTNMEKRGGGITGIELIDLSHEIKGIYQIKVEFETCDSMGANFINSILESFGNSLVAFIEENDQFKNKAPEIIMCILSNYTPDCIVRAEVSCKIKDLGTFANDIDSEEFASRFNTAVEIAQVDPYRATTHNKGIFNGIDAVVLATGNDFRAVEACGHTYAARSGQYRSLSSCDIKNGQFKFWMDIPLSVGTIGGLTKLHPIAKRSLELLGHPSASELMSIIAAVGLSQNFSAVRSLVTTGIQKGHMKMHLINMLYQFNATEKEISEAENYFMDKTPSSSEVRNFIEKMRKDLNV
ncbi:MAG: hydroxymethylglutaryl-CoA reductase, degradative [Saprospiraceae bacterium]